MQVITVWGAFKAWHFGGNGFGKYQGWNYKPWHVGIFKHGVLIGVVSGAVNEDGTFTYWDWDPESKKAIGYIGNMAAAYDNMPWIDDYPANEREDIENCVTESLEWLERHEDELIENYVR